MKTLKGLVIAAAASHSGKTSAAMGLICALNQLGLPVLAAKCGPDFIDASWLYWASGRPVANIDLHMAGENGMERLVDRIAKQAGSNALVIVEGVMGLYDGDRQGRASTAEIAAMMKLPVLLLLNAKGMGQSLAALAEGFLNFQPDWQDKTGRPQFLGLICTHAGSSGHAALCEEILRPVVNKLGIQFFGCLSSRNAPFIPARHLGLLPANEVFLEKEALAHWFASNIDLDKLLKTLDFVSDPHKAQCAQSGRNRQFFPPRSVTDKEKVAIAIAKDEAFPFIYADLPALLMEMGASVSYFSPLYDKDLPDCDGVYIPGGYPELYAERLSTNISILRALREKAAEGAPIYGECGGYIYLGQSITDGDGETWEMCGLLPVSFELKEKLQGLGYRSVRRFEEDNERIVEFGGHEFHYAAECGKPENYEPLWQYEKASGKKVTEGCVCDNVFGSWTHLYPEGSRQFWKYWLELCEASGK